MKKVCCFAGHSRLPDSEKIYDSLLQKIENLILCENVNEFRVGNYGEFDSLYARTIRRLKEKFPYISLILVIPYLTYEINNNKKYYEERFDEIIIAPIPESTPKKLRIIKRNEYMVESSDFLIYYVINHTTGADRTLEYALRKEFILFRYNNEHR